MSTFTDVSSIMSTFEEKLTFVVSQWSLVMIDEGSSVNEKSSFTQCDKLPKSKVVLSLVSSCCVSL